MRAPPFRVCYLLSISILSINIKMSNAYLIALVISRLAIVVHSASYKPEAPDATPSSPATTRWRRRDQIMAYAVGHYCPA